MAERLEVVTSRGYWKRIALLYAWCGPFAALAVATVVHDVRRGRHEMVLPMLGIAAFLLVVPLVFVFVRRWWVQYFDEHGVTLRNGRRFAWERFVKVQARTRGRRQHNHYELHFEDGVAGVYDLMAANLDEVRQVIDELRRGHNRWRAS